MENEMKEKKNEEVGNLKKINKFISIDEDERYYVYTKDGKFILEDVPYEKLMKAKKRIQRGDNKDTDKIELAVISESLIEPKIGELDLMKLRGSTIAKLKVAIDRMYDMDDFLSE